jgi:uncharacterized circularly permuted ATP-grasp superfamily protein/uncharacterized alpha-E superfamily protein
MAFIEPVTAQKKGETQDASAPRFDEMRDPSGAVRPHWAALANALPAMKADEFVRHRDAAQTMIRDNGVTYNVYDDADGQARPWQLDVVPFVIGAADWQVIEAAVIQRAILANTVLRDIYGSQRLIADGHLPAHLVLGHPQFLRPLVGVTPAHGVHVHLFSVEIARMPDGSWRVLSSRADAPSGLGYALENRIVVGQAFPDLFSEMKISRLAAFFNAYRESALSLGHSRRGRAVLLTPGPHNESYFEHAFLSNYLGLTLAEGNDLVARDGQVFLKTLMGLERVSVIFRRIDSDFCDPLEFRGDSALGIPGLVEAVRSGSVVIANALGSGVMEAPGIDAYLPGLARAVLGEDLKIPDTPTVWCGTEWGRKEALARLDRVILRDAFDARPLFSKTSSAKMGRDLSAEELQVLRERIARRGSTVVTQDVMQLGSAPVFEDSKFGARPISVRVFAAWTPHGYMVMPGGLTRVAQDEQSPVLSMQSGATSKDTWVPARGPVDAFSLLKQSGKAIEVRRTGEAPPSRAMDNLFWLGRYAERAENLARILRAVVSRFGDDPAAAKELSNRLLPPSSPAPGAGTPKPEKEFSKSLQSVLYEPQVLDGLQRLLSRVRRTAWSARDRLSLDTWRTIHIFTETETLPAAAKTFDPAQSLVYLDALVRRAAALSGLSAENMTRGPNWLFVDLGRRVERASHTAALVRHTAAQALPIEIDSVRIALEIADSAMTYRSRYLNVFEIAPLIDLLLLDDANPRSAAFQLAEIEDHIRNLPRITPGQRSDVALEIVIQTRRAAADANSLLLSEADADGVRTGLVRLTETIDSTMSRATDAITDAYFQHATYRRTGAARREAV